MRHRILAIGLVIAASLSTSIGYAADTATPARKPAGKYSPPRLWDGKPDLQGVWANNNATPLERPKILEGRERLKPEEVAALRKRQDEIFAGDGDAAFGDAIFEAVLSDAKKYKPTTFDAKTGNYNAFWLVQRDFDDRTSLIFEPANGKLPPMTAEAQARLGQTMGRMLAGFDGPESRTLAERCLTYGVPDLLAGYNSYYQIVQSPTAVVFHAEKIHDARVIPIGGGPHLPATVKSWSGDSRGHWEGDTLVVDTVNVRASVRGASESVHLIERFTRVDANTLRYEVTVDDPATWTKPWKLMIPLKRTDEKIYEYSCHEGNTAMDGILGGARAEERRAAKQAN